MRSSQAALVTCAALGLAAGRRGAGRGRCAARGRRAGLGSRAGAPRPEPCRPCYPRGPAPAAAARTLLPRSPRAGDWAGVRGRGEEAHGSPVGDGGCRRGRCGHFAAVVLAGPPRSLGFRERRTRGTPRSPGSPRTCSAEPVGSCSPPSTGTLTSGAASVAQLAGGCDAPAEAVPRWPSGCSGRREACVGSPRTRSWWRTALPVSIHFLLLK